MSGRHLAFPFKIGKDGRTATPASLDAHIRGEIIQLLLTNPGERPFLPSFGSGLRRLVFVGNDNVAAGLTKSNISQTMSHWLGQRCEVQSLEITADEATLLVDLQYKVIATDEVKQVRFEHQNEA